MRLFRVVLASGRWLGTTESLDQARWTARQFGARFFVETSDAPVALSFYREDPGEADLADGEILEEEGRLSW